ncbi:MAG: ABC transporter substrate-binding protein, partial [Betaproteobacteria bacterium]
MSVPRKLSVLAALALVLAAPYAALGQQKLKFAHVYETSEPYHTWALW